MGDDVPILGAVVTLLNAMGYCCFWWCFFLHPYGQIIIYHHWYGGWRANFGCSGDVFECNGLVLFLMMLSLHHYGQIIIYHHCIRYGRWRPNFGGSGHAFECNGLLLFFMMFSLHHYGQIIINCYLRGAIYLIISHSTFIDQFTTKIYCSGDTCCTIYDFNCNKISPIASHRLNNIFHGKRSMSDIISRKAILNTLPML